jgi:hypothetical protein
MEVSGSARASVPSLEREIRPSARTIEDVSGRRFPRGEPGEHRELAMFHQLRRVRKLDYTA